MFLAGVGLIAIGTHQIGWWSGRAVGVEAGMCEVILSAAVSIRYATAERVIDSDYCRSLFTRPTP